MSDETFNMSLRKFLKQVGVTSQQQIEKVVREEEGFSTGWLVAPATLWLVLFLVVPLASIIVFSFWSSTPQGMEPDFTLRNYGEYFHVEGFLDPESRETAPATRGSGAWQPFCLDLRETLKDRMSAKEIEKMFVRQITVMAKTRTRTVPVVIRDLFIFSEWRLTVTESRCLTRSDGSQWKRVPVKPRR